MDLLVCDELLETDKRFSDQEVSCPHDDLVENSTTVYTTVQTKGKAEPRRQAFVSVQTEQKNLASFLPERGPLLCLAKHPFGTGCQSDLLRLYLVIR